ncbi:hypothetical protein Z043_121267 [Scleropages formosus]|uniref:Uncharacterized protein n=1 Tax=Scleropages formosus TaxID=113540 RepID=A0A0P7TID0_SCLFO|nr:hypothetical protein Z043_121267 [Scleropages formosus]
MPCCEHEEFYKEELFLAMSYDVAAKKRKKDLLNNNNSSSSAKVPPGVAESTKRTLATAVHRRAASRTGTVNGAPKSNDAERSGNNDTVVPPHRYLF